MDITDITKVASRKRMNTDAEKLREKVSRETAKIIKLKVAQDTAYWDLKEKLQQVEGARERLQQNMVEVQMQHEAVSAHYQHELRLRPDTLNKLQGTRDICDVLEDYGERLRCSVARARADRAALSAAYEQCGARVRRLASAADTARAGARAARGAARRAAQRLGADAHRLADALQQLGAARARAEELAAARRAVAAQLDRATADLQRKDEAAAAMRDDVSRLVREFDAQNAEVKQIIARKEEELCAAGTLATALRSAEREAREQVARLQDELRDARADIQQREDDVQRLQQLLTEAESIIDNLKKEEVIHADNIKNMEIMIDNKNQNEQAMKAEMDLLKECVSKLETEKLEINSQLNKAKAECDERAREVDEMTRAAHALREQLAVVEAARDQQREVDSRKISELNFANEAKDRELAANTGTIAHLMAELKSETDARARADAALASARRQHDADRAAAAQREAALADQAARLDQAAQAKDAELHAQMTIIIDMRSEKERLQERIQGMQNTIDNIQKELTGRLLLPKSADDAGELPEQDAGPAAADVRRADDSTLYNFLSDGSFDGDALDPREVGRRFSALSRGAARGSLAAMRPPARQSVISLSQVKDDLKIKNKSFFKNKRFDNKVKKLK